MNTMLFQRFQFKKPIMIEDIEKGDEIIVAPDRIIIRGDDNAFKYDLAEMLSRAKLGEYDPLLATFYFQKDLSMKEKEFASMFFGLCQPLQDAWTYRIMRKYAPDVYKKEVTELFRMWESVYAGELILSDSNSRRQILGMWAILYENPENNVEIVVSSNKENSGSWNIYIQTLKKFIREDPNIKFYVMLPDITEAPYRVTVETDKAFRYYNIREKQ